MSLQEMWDRVEEAWTRQDQVLDEQMPSQDALQARSWSQEWQQRKSSASEQVSQLEDAWDAEWGRQRLEVRGLPREQREERLRPLMAEWRRVEERRAERMGQMAQAAEARAAPPAPPYGVALSQPAYVPEAERAVVTDHAQVSPDQQRVAATLWETSPRPPSYRRTPSPPAAGSSSSRHDQQPQGHGPGPRRRAGRG